MNLIVFILILLTSKLFQMKHAAHACSKLIHLTLTARLWSLNTLNDGIININTIQGELKACELMTIFINT